MAHVNIQRFYDGIITHGRRNVPTYQEARREAVELARRVEVAAPYGI